MTPQRQLRGHQPQRPTPRAVAGTAHQLQLSRRLSPRDMWLIHLLHEHRVLTVHQITELCWPTKRAANHRLLNLYKWRVIDRFQPFVTQGSAPMHYVLDIAGAKILARSHATTTQDLGYRHEDAIGIAYSLRLAHTVAINGFFTALIAQTQAHPRQGHLTTWWSEARCQRHFGDHARPDAYARWRTSRHEFEFFFELDNGTEPLTKVARKLEDYERLALATGITTPVLIQLPTATREANIRRAFTEALSHLTHPDVVPVATTAADLAGTTQRWLTLTGPPSRVSFADLAAAWPLSTTASPPTSKTDELPPPSPQPPTPDTWARP